MKRLLKICRLPQMPLAASKWTIRSSPLLSASQAHVRFSSNMNDQRQQQESMNSWILLGSLMAIGGIAYNSPALAEGKKHYYEDVVVSGEKVLYELFDSRNPLHKQFFNYMDGKQVEQRLGKEGFTVCRIDISKMNDRQLNQLLINADLTVDKISAKKKPSFCALSNMRMVKVKSSEFGAAFSEKNFMQSDQFIQVRGIKDLAESFRQYQTVDDPVIVYCAAKEYNGVQEEAIKLMRSQSKNPMLRVDDDALA